MVQEALPRKRKRYSDEFRAQAVERIGTVVQDGLPRGTGQAPAPPQPVDPPANHAQGHPQRLATSLATAF